MWRLRALHTNERGGLGVDDATGEEVKVILHRVYHHCVSCVVAALQRRIRSMRLMKPEQDGWLNSLASSSKDRTHTVNFRQVCKSFALRHYSLALGQFVGLKRIKKKVSQDNIWWFNVVIAAALIHISFIQLDLVSFVSHAATWINVWPDTNTNMKK